MSLAGLGSSKATPAHVRCQKCLNRDKSGPSHKTLCPLNLTIAARHYSYECKALAQERPYVKRPSRTQQLANPKLVPKLTNEAMQTRDDAVAAELAKIQEEKGHQRELAEQENQLLLQFEEHLDRRDRSPSAGSALNSDLRQPSPSRRRNHSLSSRSGSRSSRGNRSTSESRSPSRDRPLGRRSPDLKSTTSRRTLLPAINRDAPARSWSWSSRGSSVPRRNRRSASPQRGRLPVESPRWKRDYSPRQPAYSPARRTPPPKDRKAIAGGSRMKRRHRSPLSSTSRSRSRSLSSQQRSGSARPRRYARNSSSHPEKRRGRLGSDDYSDTKTTARRGDDRGSPDRYTNASRGRQGGHKDSREFGKERERSQERRLSPRDRRREPTLSPYSKRRAMA